MSDPLRLWKPVPSAIVDEPLNADVEWALVDLTTGKVVVRVTDAEMEARCPECGLLHGGGDSDRDD